MRPHEKAHHRKVKGGAILRLISTGITVTLIPNIGCLFQDLFFKFMLNNFLHTQVEQCLTAILTKAPAAASPEGDTDHRLLTQLFNEGRIIERVVEAFDESSERQE